MIRSGLTSSLMSSDEGGGGGESSGTEGLLRRPSDADYRAYVYVVVMVVLGSTTAAAAKFVVRELPVPWLPVVRFGVAGLCLLPMVRRFTDRAAVKPAPPHRLDAVPARVTPGVIHARNGKS
jgi:hypothetical protein